MCCYFVQENGPEREDIKENLFGRLDAVLPAKVILASSSSGLPMTPVQAACRFPERIMLGHPFNPPHLIPLVEVVGGQRTSDEMIETAMAFYAAIGKKPIRLRRELKGHIANRLQAALWPSQTSKSQSPMAPAGVGARSVRLHISTYPAARAASPICSAISADQS